MNELVNDVLFVVLEKCISDSFILRLVCKRWNELIIGTQLLFLKHLQNIENMQLWFSQQLNFPSVLEFIAGKTKVKHCELWGHDVYQSALFCENPEQMYKWLMDHDPRNQRKILNSLFLTCKTGISTKSVSNELIEDIVDHIFEYGDVKLKLLELYHTCVVCKRMKIAKYIQSLVGWLKFENVAFALSKTVNIRDYFNDVLPKTKERLSFVGEFLTSAGREDVSRCFKYAIENMDIEVIFYILNNYHYNWESHHTYYAFEQFDFRFLYWMHLLRHSDKTEESDVIIPVDSHVWIILLKSLKTCRLEWFLQYFPEIELPKFIWNHLLQTPKHKIFFWFINKGFKCIKPKRMIKICCPEILEYLKQQKIDWAHLLNPGSLEAVKWMSENGNYKIHQHLKEVEKLSSKRWSYAAHKRLTSFCNVVKYLKDLNLFSDAKGSFDYGVCSYIFTKHFNRSQLPDIVDFLIKEQMWSCLRKIRQKAISNEFIDILEIMRERSVTELIPFVEDEIQVMFSKQLCISLLYFHHKEDHVFDLIDEFDCHNIEFDRFTTSVLGHLFESDLLLQSGAMDALDALEALEAAN